MDFTTKGTYENNCIEVIICNNDTLWLNESHIEEKLDHKNLQAITIKSYPDYRKHRFELVDEPKKQSNRILLHEDLAFKIIKCCGTVESRKLKKRLGFNLHDVTNSKQQTALGAIKDVFQGENMQTQYSTLGYRLDLYFHDYKFAIENDELGHKDRDISYDTERQKSNRKTSWL